MEYIQYVLYMKQNQFFVQDGKKKKTQKTKQIRAFFLKSMTNRDFVNHYFVGYLSS